MYVNLSQILKEYQTNNETMNLRNIKVDVL